MSPAPERADPAADGQEPLSLKSLLAAWLLLPLLLLVPVAAGLQYWLTLRPALDSLDQALGDAALSIGNLVRLDADGRVLFDMSAQTERTLRTDRYDAIFYVVLGPDGERVAGDAALAQAPLVPAASAGDGSAGWDFADGRLEGEAVRVVLHRIGCGVGACEVRVAETTRKRKQAERDAMLAAAVSMLTLALLLVAVMFVAIDRGLRPLLAVREELAQRSLDNLQPLAVRRAPAEVQPLLEAINRLFVRLREAAAAQQSFLADAAHQLRTPLTALRTEAELALLEPHPPSLTPTLTRLNDSSARAARLAGQLLALARADALRADPPQPLDLRQIAGAAAQDWVPRAVAAGIDLGFDLEPAPLRGRSVLLQELLGNLLHNALEYAGDGSRVTVRTRSERGAAVLEVEDNGPGIPPADRERVFARFERGSQPRGQGSGLGLAIVRDIAVAHGARVELLDPPGGRGLLVRVWFEPEAGRAAT
jgi:two-component system sensor histidine kinase TctE